MNTLVILSTDGAGQEGRSSDVETTTAEALSAAGFRVWVTPHLYHLSNQDPLWQKIAEFDGKIAVIAWIHPRPAEWLLRARGVPESKFAGAANWASCDSPEAALTFLSELDIQPDHGPLERVGEPLSGERWYPVVDRERCTNCRSCFQFCLFGVYTVDEAGTVHTTNEDSCKTGCPACSRICPSGAISFPRYTQDEAVAGAPGTTIAFDLNAKRMFYMRTGQPCPICGQSGPFRVTLESRKAPPCPECGRPQATAQPPNAVHSEIDMLIHRLDKIAKKER